MGVEHPTRTDTKVENADRPDPPDKPPAPPRDTPGAPGYPSRRESLARAREAALQEGGTPRVTVKDSGSREPETRDDKLSSPQADSGKEKEESSGPETPDREGDAAKSDAEAGGSEAGEEAERGEGGEEERSSESEEAGQTDAEPSGGESQDERDGELADAQTESVGEKPETPEEPAPKRQHTLPAGNPDSPHLPSRRESLARAREHVPPESGSEKTETTDTSGPPHAEPAVEPVSLPPENGSLETERPQEQALSPQQDQKSGNDEPPPPSESDGVDERDMAEGVSQEPEGQPSDSPGDDLSAGPTGEPDGTANLDGSTDVADDLGRRISGEEPADDSGRRADFYDDVLERGIPDRLRRLAAKLNRSDGPRELEGLVDRPDFQDPEKDPRYTPDRYGTPLDRDDGTRTPLFKGTPKREQAEQGGLGDCGIIATLGAVAAHHPEAIRACVSETGDGNYQVRLHEAKYSAARGRYEPTGASITLTLTPDLPVLDAAPGMPAFAPIMENAAWAPVLEKAIAGWDQTWSAERWGKVKRLREAQGNSGESPKGYVRLNRGSSPGERAELLTQLTGVPAKTVQFPSSYDIRGRSADRQLSDEIAQQLSSGKPVLVGTRDKRKGESKLPKGLRANHAYEVTKVDDQGKFHLRNPWGERHPEAMTVQEFKREARPRYTTLE